MQKFGVNVPPGIPVFAMGEVAKAAKDMSSPDGEVRLPSPPPRSFLSPTLPLSYPHPFNCPYGVAQWGHWKQSPFPWVLEQSTPPPPPPPFLPPISVFVIPCPGQKLTNPGVVYDVFQATRTSRKLLRLNFSLGACRLGKLYKTSGVVLFSGVWYSEQMHGRASTTQ